MKAVYIEANVVVGGRFYAPRVLPNGLKGIILKTEEELEAFRKAFGEIEFFDIEAKAPPLASNVAEKRHLLDKIEELQEQLEGKEKEIAELEDTLRKLATPPTAEELKEALGMLKGKDEDELKEMAEEYAAKYDMDVPQTKNVRKLWLTWIYIVENRLADRNS